MIIVACGVNIDIDCYAVWIATMADPTLKPAIVPFPFVAGFSSKGFAAVEAS